ncbi:MAG: hypothetical protein IJ804_01440 [Prevotella sp.]|nr:hypothetical protein [Prevotella sp.]
MVVTFGMNVNAQTVIANDYGSPISGADGQSVNSNDDEEELKSSFDISYQAIENGFGLGMTWVFNHIVLNGSMISGETNSYIKKNEGWRIGLGLNYRHWLANFLFIEGQAGVEYTHGTVEIKVSKNETSENSEGNFGMFLTPRVGLKALKIAGTDWGVVAGYRWDFNKFKFDKDYTAKYFTIGLIGVF